MNKIQVAWFQWETSTYRIKPETSMGKSQFEHLQICQLNSGLFYKNKRLSLILYWLKTVAAHGIVWSLTENDFIKIGLC